MSSSFFSTQPFKWQPRLKHSDINIKGNTITCMINGRNGYGRWGICSLTDPILNEKGIHKWSVQINKLKEGMYLGMCQIRQACSHRFEYWGWQGIGHGHYCVSSKGYIYTHIDDELNRKIINDFKFYEGDFLQFEYNSILNKLVVVDNNRLLYNMDVEKDTAENYAICAYLFDSGDSIELIFE